MMITHDTPAARKVFIASTIVWHFVGIIRAAVLIALLGMLCYFAIKIGFMVGYTKFWEVLP